MIPQLVLLASLLGLAADGEQGFSTIKPQLFDREKKAVPDIWILDFQFRNPRYIQTLVPGKGRKVLWYMRYKIVNRTGKDRTFIPEFTLVTEKGEIYKDVIIPQAEKAVVLREDPLERVGLLNSVTIAKPIPPTPDKGDPIIRHGVAFWEDVPMTTNRFAIYVTGLSNGYTRVADPMSGEETFRRKTLKIEFLKKGDAYNISEKEFTLSDEPTWEYR